MLALLAYNYSGMCVTGESPLDLLSALRLTLNSLKRRTSNSVDFCMIMELLILRGSVA